MIYDVRQTLTNVYRSAVPLAHHVLRVTPGEFPGQTTLTSELTIEPRPDELTHLVDFFGNRTTHVRLDAMHVRLRIDARATVEVAAPRALDSSATPPWEDVAATATADRGWLGRAPAHFLYPSPRIPADPAVREYAATSFHPDRAVLAAGLDLMARIRRDFAYDPDATDVSTPVGQAFAMRRGVCQDFAHIMITGLRGLGLPAAYVSGYLRTIPLPGAERLEGADAMHAWVALWCGRETGWVGLDPTNNLIAGADHITVGYGRDYSDVAPITGVIVNAGRHTLTTTVDVVPRAAD